jgi:putative DNA primase/helicase
MSATDLQLLNAALGYAARGLRVFPVYEPLADGACSCGRDDCQSIGKHPRVRDQHQQATTDPTRIREWWARWLNASVAIATGAGSGLVVLDLDVRAAKGIDGIARFQELLEAHQEIPRGAAVETGSGLQLYYRYPDGGVATAHFPEFGADVLADGAHVVAAPSWHRSQKRYRLVNGPLPADLPVFPMALIDLLAPQGKPGSSGPIREGGRNNELFRLAAKYRGQGAEGEALVTTLLDANSRCVPPMPADYVIALAKRVERSYEPNFDYSDVSVGRRFATTYAGRVINVGGETGRSRAKADWHVFDGTRWRPDGNAATALAIELTDDLMEMARKSGDDKVFARAVACRSQQRIERSLLLAQTDDVIRVAAKELDADPYLFNCPNGTVDLRTGALRAHSVDDLITKLAAARFDPDAKCPEWKAFISLVCGGDRGLARYLQKAVGWSLIGDPERRAAMMLVGSGFNGKTTFLDTLLAVLGDYGQTGHPTLLLRKNLESESELNPVLVGLRGARFVVLSETDSRGHFSPAKLKQLTGGGSVSARKLYGDPIEFRPTFKIFVDTNVLPDVSETDKATRDRIVVIPFIVNLEEALEALGSHEKKNFAAELAAEAEGILAWAVRGCLAYLDRGMKKPKAIRLATGGFWDEQDRIAQFLDELCDVSPGRWAYPLELYMPYRNWSEDRGEKPLNMPHFKRKLLEKGFKRVKSAGQEKWTGVGIDGLQEPMLPTPNWDR